MGSAVEWRDLAHPNDLVTQTVTRRYGGPTPQERVWAEYNLDILHPPIFCRAEQTKPASTHRRVLHPSVASPALGRIYGWAELVGTTHMGKLDPGLTFVNLSVLGVSKEVASRISPRLTSVATLSFSHPSMVISRQWKWHGL